MKFDEWWNGPSGFGNFTVKELAEDVGVPVKFKDYIEDLEEAFYAGKPKPSTDFRELDDNPYKHYLVYDEYSRCWHIGYFNLETLQTVVVGKESLHWSKLSLSHWLPMPDAPDT